MIARLTGRLDGTGPDWAVIDVGGVGYLVFCPTRTLARLEAAGGAPVSVLVETHVREDHIHLYGFAEAAEREWFRLLTTVQGVGTRLALALLSVLDPAGIAQAIVVGDRAALARADGVGPKLALRIIGELKDRASRLALAPGAGGGSGSGPEAGAEGSGGSGNGGSNGGSSSPTPAGVTTVVADAVSALVNLGYGRSEAFTVALTVARGLGDAAAVGSVIRDSLKELGRRAGDGSGAGR